VGDKATKNRGVAAIPGSRRWQMSFSEPIENKRSTRRRHENRQANERSSMRCNASADVAIESFGGPGCPSDWELTVQRPYAP